MSSTEFHFNAANIGNVQKSVSLGAQCVNVVQVSYLSLENETIFSSLHKVGEKLRYFSVYFRCAYQAVR